MSDIKISVDELYENARAMKEDGMDSVEISIIDGDEGLFMSFTAHSKAEPFVDTEYEFIDALDDSDDSDDFG